MADARNMRLFSQIEAEELARLRAHGFALALAGAAWLARLVLGANNLPSAFVFAGCAVAIATWRGGFTAGTVAALTTTLLARATTSIDLVTSLRLTADTLLLAFLVSRYAASLADRTTRLAAAELRIRELQASERD